MTNTLTKDISTTILNPGVAADPGVPPSPAYCTTTSTTTTPTLTKYVYDEHGELQAFGYSGSPVTTYETICYPATDGIPPTQESPGDVLTQFNLGWNSGARSVGTMAGDGASTFSVATGVVGVVVGLHAGVAEFSFSEAEHALYFRSGMVSVLESGGEKTGSMPYVESDVFRIERVASVVRYFMGGALLFTSGTPSYGTQFLESSLYAGGDSILNAALSEAITAGLGSGGAVLYAVAARGGDESSDGGVALPGMMVSGGGIADQGGGAVLAGFLVGGSSSAYAGGGAVLASFRARGEAGTAPTFALGSARVGRVGASGYGLTSGNTTEPGNVSLGSVAMLGGDYDYGGGSAVLTPITARGEEGVKLTRSLAVAELGVLAATGYGMTSGNTVNPLMEPSGATLAPLSAIGANYPYAGGSVTLAPFAAGSIAVIGTMSAIITGPGAKVRAFFRSSAMEFGAIITGPRQSARGYFGFHIKAIARAGKISASATGTALFGANITSPGASVDATGTVSGTMRANIGGPKFSIVGHFGMVCRITIAGRAGIQASFISGAAMSASITNPKAGLSAFRVTSEGYFGAIITGPMAGMGATMQARIIGPGARAVAVFSTFVAAVYEAYSVNLTHAGGDQAPVDEVTRYTNFPFTRIVRFQGDYYGVAIDGLYKLGGATDDDEAIAYAVKTCISDFDAPELKNVASAYLSGRLGPLTVSLHAGEDGAESYAFDTLRGPLARTHREKFGRGVRNRYFALGLVGSDALELDAIELEINKTGRRI